MNRRNLTLFIITIYIGCYCSVSCAQNSLFENRFLTPEDKSRVIALYEKGNQHLLKKEWPQAERALLDIIKITPDIPAIHHSLGLIYVQTGDTTSAIMFFQQALNKQPNEFKYLYALGRSYNRLKKTQKAKEYFEKAIEADGTKEYVYQDLAGIHYDQGEWEIAMNYLEKALELNPGSYFTLKLMAYTAMRLERIDTVMDIVMKLKKMKQYSIARQLEELLNKM